MENTYRKWQELEEKRASDLEQANNLQKRIIAEQNVMQEFLHRQVTSRLEGYYLNWNILMEVVEKIADKYGDTITLEIRNNKPRVTIIGKGIPFLAYTPDDNNTTPIQLMYASLLKIIAMKKYPFNEGDDYWTIEDGVVVHSCWDDISEQLYDANPNQKYFATEEECCRYASLNNEPLYASWSGDDEKIQGKQCSKCYRSKLVCYCDMD